MKYEITSFHVRGVQTLAGVGGGRGTTERIFKNITRFRIKKYALVEEEISLTNEYLVK